MFPRVFNSRSSGEFYYVWYVVFILTPQELERIACRMYGRKHWRSRLASNLGLDNSTVWRATKKTQVPFLMEVAVRGLDERHKLLRSAEKVNNEMLRQQGKLRPKLKRKKAVA